jgi:hypothetical protein
MPMSFFAEIKKVHPKIQMEAWKTLISKDFMKISLN